ncbi:hypothetical protein C8F04DRAFT_1341769 [Mycena alexandri]|uniref:Retrovirus-related Pol polyprotein from transposon TNT 1-94-like beta-barrel domain-containing protein n=1 Tax=Mycena alexandri TaxID=1745969 RepID=A0AAD6SXS7_9AGAR|nr:hypothetical protein C8F04DRAFT_1341769 [Mycena alexandri]
MASTLLAQPNLTLASALAALDARQARHLADGQQAGNVAFAVHSKNISCTNKSCPKPGTHTWPYCTSSGGGMDGKTIPEAQQKYREDRDRAQGKTAVPPKDQKPKGPRVKRDDGGRAYITLQGVDCYITPAPSPAAVPVVVPAAPIANIALAHAAESLITDPIPNAGDDLVGALEVWLANDSPRSSVDWNVQPTALSASDGYDLFADTGANVHISPEKADFVTFQDIAPRPVNGFQGSSIMARGIGTVRTRNLTLELALYIPGAAVRLLSVVRICQANPYEFHFDDKAVWITNKTGLSGQGSIANHFQAKYQYAQ